MKPFRILLLGIVLLFCQSVFAQPVNSSVTIKFNAGNYRVSGVVTNEAIRSEVVEKIKARLGTRGDFSALRSQSEARSFQTDWRDELDKALLKIKDWKSGVFIFSNRKRPDDTNYPLLPETIANAEISLTTGEKVSIKDYRNKVVVLFFFASWVAPGRDQAVTLNNFYRTVSQRNVEIIGINGDNDPAERRYFSQFGKSLGLDYKLGLMKPELFPEFVKISRLKGIPQSFVIYNGKLRGIFTGGGSRVQRKLEQTILEILDENNL